MRVLYQNKHIFYYLLVFLFGFFLSLSVRAQEPLTDRELLEDALPSSNESSHEAVSFMASGSSRLLIRYNPLRLGLGGLMYVYQRYISPQLPSECLYHPSCSGFSKELIREYGLLPGMFATADRLMRCNRMAALDTHPLEINQLSGKVHEDVQRYKKHQ